MLLGQLDLLLTCISGAKLVFNSLISPLFARFFQQGGSTSANLQSQADAATKSQ